MTDDDPVLDALRNLRRVLDESLERNRAAYERAKQLESMRDEGLHYRDIVQMESRPLIVEILTVQLKAVAEASSLFRKAEARALYSEGLTMTEIASLFGVTRQRVAALIDRPGDEQSLREKDDGEL